MKKAVVVLGVGSDGTSLFAGVLYRLGFYLGEDEDLIAPNKQNPKGFYEHKMIPDINRVILKEHGIGEYEMTGIVEKSIYQNEIEAFFEKTFKGKNRIALKDPRLCVTLPIWANVISKTHELTVLNVHRSIDTHLVAITDGGKKTGSQATSYINNRKDLQLVMSSRYFSIDVQFEDFIKDPEVATKRLVKELKIRVTKKQMVAIVEFIS